MLSGGSGLNNGDKILITNSLDSYTGFWILTAIGPNVFTMKRYTGGSTLEYTATATPDIYLCEATVVWSCAHLPILYRLSSNLYPVNTSDSIRGVTGFANDNGFVRITLSGTIDAEVLDWLNIASTSEDELDGPFQIVTKWSASQFTINAPYSVAQASVYTYATATAQKYYHNYHLRVRVYGGLPTGHTWQALKPYVLITECKLVPDEDGIILVNIAEAIKEQLEIRRNRPNYDSMPYDLDRFAAFYIETAESYDVIGAPFVGSYTSDRLNFEGYAADAMLEFKNRYSGFMSEYVYGSLLKFLTFASRPVLFNGNYFDLSFITPTTGLIAVLQKTYDASDNELDSYFELYYNNGLGIIRSPIEVIGAESYQKVSVANVNALMPNNWVNGTAVTALTAFDSLVNGETVIATSNNVILGRLSVINYPLQGSDGDRVALSVVLVASGDITMTVYASDVTGASFLQLATTNVGVTGATLNIDTIVTGFTPYYIQVFAENNTGGTITSVVVSLERITYSEEKRLDINTKCLPQYIYLTWKNALGGFDYWLFTGEKDYNINLLGTQEKIVNLYPDWDKSYSESADTVTYESSRKSRREMVLRSQNLTREQLDFVVGIRLSSLVQQMTSKYDRRGMRVDARSFTIRSDQEKNAFSIEFTIAETNEVASQSL